MTDQYIVQPGTVFAGDFRVDRALSQGGMGAVYIAEQLSTGKQRALKVMLPALVSDPALRKRFEQEARIGSMIESEHIVEVVGAGIDQGTELPWLAMELLQGEDLDHVVMARGALPVQEVVQLFQQLCHAVGAAHRVGVVHRDLKPENIFLAKARRADASFMVKVLDFGIAKIVAEASTKQTAAMGSPIWMAPEQADQSPITPATDVWALGLIAFFLLTGRPFWKSANDDTSTIPMVLKEVLFEPILPASARTAAGRPLPPGFDEWFSHCVARDPAHRFPDATQAGAALLAMFGSPSSGAQSGAYAQTMPPNVPSYGGTAPGLPMGHPGSVSSPGYGSGGYGSGPVGQHAPQTGTAPMRAASGPIVMHPGAPTGPSGSSPPGVLGPSGIAATGAAGSFTIPGDGAPKPKKVPAGVAVAIVLAVAGIAVTGVVLVTKSHSTHATAAGPSASNAPDPSSPDMATVAEAKKLSDEGKYDQAHQHLAQLGASSDARRSTLFKEVEYKWATETLLLADRTSDVPTKRVLIASVAQSTAVDETLRSSAQDKLAAMDAPAPVDGGVANANLTVTGLHVGGHKVIPGVAVTPPTPPEPQVVAPPPPPPQPPPAPTRSVLDLAASKDPGDWGIARRAIEPRVTGGTATLEEAHALLTVCDKEKDRACQKTCKTYIAYLKSKR